MIYIASDHGGYNLKNEIIKYLQQQNLECEDLGPYELDPIDDYVEYTLKLVERTRYDENSKGILLCRNGVGVSMLANKFKGVSAALCFDPKHAQSSRNDDNSNVLALPSDYLNPQKALELVRVWLDTPFSNAERHVKRTNEVGMYGQE